MQETDMKYKSDNPLLEHCQEKCKNTFKSVKEKQLYEDGIQSIAAHSSVWEGQNLVTMDDLIGEADFAEFFDTGPEIKVEPVAVEQPETSDVSIETIVTDLEVIKRSKGDKMFSLIEQFCATYGMTKPTENQKSYTNNEILSELYKIQDDMRKEEEVPESPNSSLDHLINSNSAERAYRQKRKVNNAAANRCRAKKRRLIADNIEKISKLEQENPKLRKTLDGYENELKSLKRKLSVYENST